MRTLTPVYDPPAEAKRPATESPPVPPRRDVRRRFRADKSAVLASALLALLLGCALFAPMFSPYTGDINFDHRFMVPSWEHPFGTDDLGRDVFLRVMEGGRISLAAGLIAMLCAMTIGVIIGSLSGYYGGFVDSILMRFVDLFLSVPAFFLILFLASVLTPGLILICTLIAATQWMEVARLVRSVVLGVKQHDFVDAARALGASDNRILFRHILSHTGRPLIVAATIGVAQAIMTESAISFLGFGVQPPAASWGSMLTHAQSYLGSAPWLAIFPGVMIFLTVLSCYALGDHLRTFFGTGPR